MITKTLFYETHVDQARILSLRQARDGWTFEARRQFWEMLGYDYFFAKQVALKRISDYTHKEQKDSLPSIP
jgi:hypothetical protein